MHFGHQRTPSTGVVQPYALIAFLDDGTTGVEKINYALTTVNNGTADEEKVSAFPAVAGDIVFFTTTLFRPSTPCLLSDANLYAFTFIGGPAYDNTGDGTITNADTPKVATLAGARATAPFIVDRHLIFGSGTNVQVFGDKDAYDNSVGQAGVRILSWRELR